MTNEWIRQHFPDSIRVEPHARDGLDVMVVPDGTADLFQEIVDGVDVCEALFMALTADTRTQLDQDLARLQEAMNRYAEAHPVPALAPK